MEKKERNLKIINEYNDGVSMSELVVTYSLHRSTIQKILIRYGVKLHKAKSFIKCNRNFFNEYTKESVYWAGFILADGNLRKNRNSLQIKLSKIDKDHLYKFLKVISCDENWRVKEYNNVEHPCVSLTISLDEFKKDLFKNFDIEPKKTLTATISNKIPNNMLNHFIRGYMDGDGSISKSRVPNVSFVGTESVLGTIRSYFKDELNIILKSKNDVPPINNINNGIGVISYSGKNAKFILDELYSDITDTTILSRKYEKYQLLFENY